MSSQKLKLISAAVGGSAVVAMGALTMGLANDSASTTVVSDPELTLGETTTSETGVTEIETSLAVPPVTAEPPDGFGP